MENKESSVELQTPAELGFVFPAEWETHEATWINWPHNRTDWPSKFRTIPWVYGEIVRKLAPGEKVRIFIKSPMDEPRVRSLLKRVDADLSSVGFFPVPSNRGWVRDHGPLFLRRVGKPGAIGIARFRFNGWAKYEDWEMDDAIPDLVGQWLGCPVFRPYRQGRDVVLEGGSFDVNGCGSLLTTEECLLDKGIQVRNPGMGQKELEEILCSYVGVTQVLWLGRGIAGDDTHGHVDDLCRFVDKDRVVLCRESNPHDVNYTALEENRERLEGMRLSDGTKIEVIPLPMPAPLYFDGIRLPASYANFYVSNSAVLVPTFNDPRDRVALGILGELFPDRPTVGIHSVDLVWGLGALHCLSQQQPALL